MMDDGLASLATKPYYHQPITIDDIHHAKNHNGLKISTDRLLIGKIRAKLVRSIKKARQSLAAAFHSSSFIIHPSFFILHSSSFIFHLSCERSEPIISNEV